MMTDLIQTLKVIHSATVYHFLYVGGITHRSGRRGFAVYRDGMVAQYTAKGWQLFARAK